MKKLVVSLLAVVAILSLTRPVFTQYGIQLTFPDQTGYWIEYSPE